MKAWQEHRDGNTADVIDQGDRWARALVALNMNEAEFLKASQFDPARRTYQIGEQVAKITLLDRETTGHLRANDHKAEFELLRHCKGLRGVPKPVMVLSARGVSALVATFVPGKPAEDLSLSASEAFIVLCRLSALLMKLSSRGISHNDIEPRNVVVSHDLRVGLVDFDQAAKDAPVRALLNNFIGIRPGGFGRSSLLGLFRGPLRRRLPRAFVAAYRRFAGHEVAGAANPPARSARDATNRTILLHKAWRIATASDATSPGFPVAYYALSVDGIELPGERPWEPRWQQLRSATELRGKRVLELGCNMALFSTFAIFEESAACALAVDADANILKAATLVAQAYGTRVELVQQDFDEKGWEDRLAAFRPDVVTALSVVQWVADKPRLLRFLGRFPELLYEGHDPVDVERERLLRVGFNNIKLLGMSERNRPLFYAARAAG